MNKSRKLISFMLALVVLVNGQGITVLAEEQELPQVEEIAQKEEPATGFDSKWKGTVRGANKKGSNATGANLDFKYSNVTRVFDVTAPEYGAVTTAEDQKSQKKNYTAIQSAIDDAHEYQMRHPRERCKVVIPPGTYKLYYSMSGRGGLVIYSNLWIYARGAVIIRCTPWKKNLMRTAENGVGGYGGTKNVLIEGGTWDGYGSKSGNSNTMIRFSNASNIVFLDCTFRDSFESHQLEFGGVKGLTISGCTFRQYSQNSASLKKEAIQLDICNNSRIMPGAVYDDSVCQNVLIINNAFTDLYRAIGTHSAVVGLTMNDITISKNTFLNIRGKAISSYNYKNCTISGNRFINCSEAIDFRAVSMSNAYANNFYPPANGRIPVARTLYANLWIKDNVINKSRFGDAPNTAICINGAKVTKAYYRNGKLAVPVGNYYVSDVYIENNVISGKSNGVSLIHAKNVLMKGNRISACGKNGVLIKDKSEVVISGDRIYGNVKNGISTGGSTLTIVGNTKVYSNYMTGIYLYDSAKVSMSNSSSCSNIGAGITLTKKSTGLLKNVISDSNGHVGVLVEKGSSATFKGGSITKSKSDGVQVINSKIYLYSGCSIKENKQHGLALYDRSNAKKVSHAKISENKQNGLMLSGGSSASISSESRFEKNKKSGIAVSSGWIKIEKSTIQGNAKQGMEISNGSKAFINNNTIAKNGKFGVNTKNSTISLKNNRITGNGKSAVALYDLSIATAIKKNVFSNKSKKEIVISGGSIAPVKTGSNKF